MNFDENSRIMTKVFDEMVSSVWLLSFLHKMNCVNIFRLKILPTSSNSYIDILNCNFYHSISFRRRILRQTYSCRFVRFGYSISVSTMNNVNEIRVAWVAITLECAVLLCSAYRRCVNSFQQQQHWIQCVSLVIREYQICLLRSAFLNFRMNFDKSSYQFTSFALKPECKYFAITRERQINWPCSVLSWAEFTATFRLD